MASFNNYTILSIDDGTVPNDGTGDPVRNAFEKVNNNFSNIANFLQSPSVDFTAANVTTLSATTLSVGSVTGNLNVAGNLNVTKDVVITGNLTVANVLNISSTNLTTTDPLVYFESTSVFPYTYDIGLYSHFIGGPANVYAHSGLVRANSTEYWTFFSNVKAEPVNNAINIADAGIIYDTVKAGTLILANTTASTSTTTGALQVAGGAGFGGDIRTAGNIFATGNIYIGTSPVLTANNVGLYGNVYAGTVFASNVLAAAATPSTSALTGALVVPYGGVGVAGNLNVGGNVNATGITGAFYGAVQNPSQTNITVVGTLGNLTVASAGTITIGTTSINQTTIGVTNLTTTTGAITNFTSSNAKVTGGFADNLAIGANVAASARFSTSVVTNFSTANARVTGGYADNLTIGGNVAATGTFANLRVTTNATGQARVLATAAPTIDQVLITNAGFPTVTAGTSALQVAYIGGAAAVEASAIRADMTPGGTSGAVWNAFRVAPTAAAVAGETVNGVKCDAKTAGAGTSNAVYVGTGWDNIVNYNGTIIISGTGDINSPGNITATGNIGYTVGSGGVQTQATSKATTVVLSKPTGRITLNAAALAPNVSVSFTLTNTFIAPTDMILLNHVSGGSQGAYGLAATPATGSANITVRNNTTFFSLSEAIVIQYAIIKAPIA